MPHNMIELGTAGDWLKCAKSNLAIAKQPKSDWAESQIECTEP